MSLDDSRTQRRLRGWRSGRVSLRFPFLNLVDIFLAGDGFRGGGEFDRPHLAFDLTTQRVGESEQLRRGEIGEITLSQFLFHLAEFFGESADAMLDISEHAIVELIQRES